jgi:hypothetical protein
MYIATTKTVQKQNIPQCFFYYFNKLVALLPWVRMVLDKFGMMLTPGIFVIFLEILVSVYLEMFFLRIPM